LASPEPRTILFVIGGPIGCADVPGLCERVRVLADGSDAEVVVCDVGALVDPDAVTVDALARLQLTARRLGRRVRLRHASAELRELLAFVGLDEVVPFQRRLRLGLKRQTEEREQARGVEERVGTDDLTSATPLRARSGCCRRDP
jgi:ABC-type transporter Mla MlaB component